MRSSDWSADVCTSDLAPAAEGSVRTHAGLGARTHRARPRPLARARRHRGAAARLRLAARLVPHHRHFGDRAIPATPLVGAAMAAMLPRRGLAAMAAPTRDLPPDVACAGLLLSSEARRVGKEGGST